MSARARAQALSTLSRSLGSVGLSSADGPAGEPSLTEEGIGGSWQRDASVHQAHQLRDQERSLHAVLDLVEQSMPRAEAETQLEEMRERLGRLEQLDWRTPPSAASATLAKDTLALQRSLARLEHEQRLQAARLEDRPFLGSQPPPPAGVSEAKVAEMIEGALGAAVAKALAERPPRPGGADGGAAEAMGAKLDELQLSAAAMNPRLLACEEQAAEAAALSERGVADALPAMEDRVTAAAVAEASRALREELGAVRGRCASNEDEISAARRAAEAALEAGLSQLGSRLREETHVAVAGLCRTEELRQASAELSASIGEVREADAKEQGKLRLGLTEQVAEAAAVTRGRLDASETATESKLDRLSDRLGMLHTSTGAFPLICRPCLVEGDGCRQTRRWQRSAQPRSVPAPAWKRPRGNWSRWPAPSTARSSRPPPAWRGRWRRGRRWPWRRWRSWRARATRPSSGWVSRHLSPPGLHSSPSRQRYRC